MNHQKISIIAAASPSRLTRHYLAAPIDNIEVPVQ